MESVDRGSQFKKTFIDFRQMSEFVKAPLVFTKAEGLYYWDESGKKYFDAIGGVFVASLGHRHPALLEALHKQAERITFAPPLHGSTDIALDYIDKLGKVSPENLNYIKTFSGGSEANESVIKFSRQYFKQTGFPQKYKIINQYLGYHGGTLATVAASGGADRKAKFEPEMPGFIKVFSPKQLRKHFSTWEETCRFTAGLYEEVIINESPDTVAAIMLEPISNTAGIITPTKEFYEIIRKTCDKYNVLMIFDEVLTGFGKTGNLFSAQTYGVIPDVISSGKGMCSGVLPTGVTMMRENYADVFYGKSEDNIQFMHGHTFAGNPLVAAVGSAVLDIIEKEKLLGKVRENGQYLDAKLEGLKKTGVIKEIRGQAMLKGVELDMDAIAGNDPKKIHKFGEAMKSTALKNGLVMRINPDWFAVGPALTIDHKGIDEMVGLIESTLTQVLGEF
ncbi:MAG: aminotransferase class III-fold pyridoxal phosphate-dependent enzyme [Bacilli bacterium]|jgi:adenosylmethionine-8-amino-7-oxononanoate aminotransferase